MHKVGSQTSRWETLWLKERNHRADIRRALLVGLFIGLFIGIVIGLTWRFS
jgi:Mg/Co/Ni transporter MgtE